MVDQRKKTRAFVPGAKAAARSGSARTDAGSGHDRNPPARPASAHVEDDDEKTLTAWPAVQPDARTRDIEVGGEPATGMRGPRPGANVPAAGMSPHTPLPDPMLGKIIAGRYRIVSKLGEGGMGSVYLAQHVTLEKQVALKVLHGEFVRKSELVERFLQEAKAASRIRHQNVIDITDFGSTDEGTVFFAMEVLDGHDLHEIITRAKLEGRRVPWARSRKIFLQICAALSAAHACGIVHRDLKPENIYLVEWLGHKDFVKLLDFGIAKLTEVSEHDRKLTRTGMLFGTPEYMSPEQARGEKVDHRVDVYAMGIILYQLVTGSVPFEAESFMGVLSRHLSDEPPSIADDVLAAIGAPLGVNVVIRKALAKNRDARYATIDELAAALEGPGDVHIHDHDHGEAVPVAASAATSGGSAVPAEIADSPSMATRKRTRWTGRVAMSAAESAGASAQRSASPLLWITVVLAVAAVGAGGYMLVMRGTTTAGSGAAGTASAAADSPAGAPAAVALVTLTFATEPSGAEVLDDEGAMLGKTPLEYTLPQGREVRRFRFRLPAHQDKIIEVVPAHSARHMVELTASIDDVSGPAGGETARQTPDVGEAAQPSDQAPARAPGSAAKGGSNAARDQRGSTSKVPAGKPADEHAPDESDDNDSADDPVIKNPFAD